MVFMTIVALVAVLASWGVAQQRVTLRFWMSADPALEQAMDALLQAYMRANPNVTVQREIGRAHV